MIVNDTERQEITAARNHRDSNMENFLHCSQEEVKDHVYTARLSDPSRLGAPMFPAEFERRLKRLNANLFFEVIAENPTHKRMSTLDQRGRHVVCVYENSLMPERSIPRIRTMEVPDVNWDHSKTKRIDFNFADEEALKPGWRKISIPWGESKRGWRTVLVRLIQAGLITVTQAETEFGADETPEWRQHTGKGEFTTPF